jgi:hypothetical protein
MRARLSQFPPSFQGACPTLTFLLRRTIHNHLRRSRPEKILNVFRRIHLRFFRACGLASGRTSFASSRRQCRTGSWPVSMGTLATFSLSLHARLFFSSKSAWSILDCACSASGRISRLPSHTGRRWREILNRGQNGRKASVSGIGGKTHRVPQAARTSDVVRSTTLRSC